MFSLLKGLWKWLFSRQEISLLILGIDNAGKTTTLEQMKRIFGKSNIPLDRITPTVGLNIATIQVDEVLATFWDLGGQSALRTIWEKYYADCGGILFILDSTDLDPDRINEAKAALHTLVEHPAIFERQVPIVIMANKQDVVDKAASIDTVSNLLDIYTLPSTCIIHILPTSAINNTNIESGIRLLVDAARLRLANKKPK